MGRLIDVDSVMFTNFEIIACEGDYKKAFKLLCEKLDNAPTVEVVRCKECKYRGEYFSCPMPYRTDGDFFCKEGKRR